MQNDLNIRKHVVFMQTKSLLHCLLNDTMLTLKYIYVDHLDDLNIQ